MRISTLDRDVRKTGMSQSEKARMRNERAIRIEITDNGFIVTEMGTGSTRVYENAGIRLTKGINKPANVLEHLIDFLAERVPVDMLD